MYISIKKSPYLIRIENPLKILVPKNYCVWRSAHVELYGWPWGMHTVSRMADRRGNRVNWWDFLRFGKPDSSLRLASRLAVWLNTVSRGLNVWLTVTLEPLWKANRIPTVSRMADRRFWKKITSRPAFFFLSFPIQFSIEPHYFINQITIGLLVTSIKSLHSSVNLFHSIPFFPFHQFLIPLPYRNTYHKNRSKHVKIQSLKLYTM